MQNKFLTTFCGAMTLLIPFGIQAANDLPPSAKIELGTAEEVCSDYTSPEWREAQVIDGVQIQESRLCNPDNPAEIAAFVKGTNNISMSTLMDTQLSADSIIKTNDVDGDGDPDHIIIKLEIVELNGHSPDSTELTTQFDIAPGVQPTFWVFAPKTRDMSTLSLYEPQANPLLRVPSPTIRVEEGDTVWLVVENTHHMPHSLHLHGVDHPYMDHSGTGNDGVGQTSAMDIMPGESKTYVIKPRQAGSFYYHCHVQPHTHIPMGLQGILVVEENRPNNWVQTFNVGNGQVRHPSVAVLEKYAREYDMHYQSADKELHELARSANDPRLLAQKLNMEYDVTEATDDYFMLNGRSFPYTIRESLVEMRPDEKVKLRVLNGHTEALGLHIHGHRPMITHYDGIDNGPGSYIRRDVHTMVPAQRIDLELDGTDDGLHSFGEGVWMMHDHVEKSFTTNGIGEGGDITLVVYNNFLDEKGIPKMHGWTLAPYFTKEFWQGKYPLWQDYDQWQSLGLPDARGYKAPLPSPPQMILEGPSDSITSNATTSEKSFIGDLFSGFLLGLVAYVLIIRREDLVALYNKIVKKTAAS